MRWQNQTEAMALNLNGLDTKIARKTINFQSSKQLITREALDSALAPLCPFSVDLSGSASRFYLCSLSTSKNNACGKKVSTLRLGDLLEGILSLALYCGLTLASSQNCLVRWDLAWLISPAAAVSRRSPQSLQLLPPPFDLFLSFRIRATGSSVDRLRDRY
ncbi:hypothetical protein O181_031571 [Austropuccinia psidii MF-1]|uniref:Uncharacterized protein n=1 Tax=Austropuccinia psidii MF-1 TaxID=1389203 RepID=A0A9Q3D0R0_9BASI|nr:hypothetical protein [Austropuccinia psidii MF-1]